LCIFFACPSIPEGVFAITLYSSAVFERSLGFVQFQIIQLGVGNTTVFPVVDTHHSLAAMLVVVGAAEEHSESPVRPTVSLRCIKPDAVWKRQTWKIGGDLRSLRVLHPLLLVALLLNPLLRAAAVVAEEKPRW
jgi:hypothetical protein